MLKIKKSRVTEEEVNIIRQHYLSQDPDKIYMKELALILGRHPLTIGNIYKKLHGNINYSTYRFKENYFECIDHQTKAYWLGFLCADGCIPTDRDRVMITLSSRDKHHLEKLKLILKVNNKIRTYTDMDKAHSTIREKCRLYIGSKKIVSDLISHGCIRNKTTDLKFPDHLPMNMIPHWIRGFIDGDGSFNTNTTGRSYLGFSVCGTRHVISNINLHLGINATIHFDKRTPILHYIQTRKYANIVKIAHYLYDGAEVFLERKREKLNCILGSINAH